VLRDAARLAGGDLGAPDEVEQRGLAVVDVAHDGHDRRTRQFLGLGLALQVLFQFIGLEQDCSVSHFGDHELRGLLVDGLVDGRHYAEVHQGLDDVRCLDRHLLRDFADGDRLADGDLALDRLRRQLELLALVGLHRRAPPAAAGTALAVLGGQASGDVQLVAAVAGRLGVLLRGTAQLLGLFLTLAAFPLGLVARPLLAVAARLFLGGGLAAFFLFRQAPRLLVKLLALTRLQFALAGLILARRVASSASR